MELINLPRLRNKELQSVAESTLLICATITEVQPALTKVDTQLEAFKQGMLKEQASAADKSELDKQRDRLLSGFMQNLKTERYFPHQDSDKVKALNSALPIAEKYGTQITRLPYNEETAAIDNLIAEWKQLNTDLLDEGITRWIPLIETVNNNFKSASHSYISSQAQADSAHSASELAPALRTSLEGVYTLLFAHTKITASEPILKAYRELEQLIKGYN